MTDAEREAEREANWFKPGSQVQVKLHSLIDETRCPICWGRIKAARVSIVCLHRYCAPCIEQFLRTEMNGKQEGRECPVCRAHLHSRRATKPDPKFDIIIQALYGDAAKYDEEEDRLLSQDNQVFIKAQQKAMQELKIKLDESRKNYKPSKAPKGRTRTASQGRQGGGSRKRAAEEEEEEAEEEREESKSGQWPNMAGSASRDEARADVEKEVSMSREEEAQAAKELAHSLLSRAAAADTEQPACNVAMLVHLKAKERSEGLIPLTNPYMVAVSDSKLKTVRTELTTRLLTTAGRPVPFSSLHISPPPSSKTPTATLPDPLDLTLGTIQQHQERVMKDLVLEYSVR